jgi:two-component system response regulator (stage 0 sporulation protein F)
MSPALGRILVVDDEAPVREVLTEYFSSHGYTVDTASNGNDALATIRRDRPDLVLLDVRMPGIDGVEVLRRIRKLDDTLTVIMVTANEDVALARETLRLGALDYVAKPFDDEELLLLLSVATDLGDLPGSDKTLVETALEAARRALPVAP